MNLEKIKNSKKIITTISIVSIIAVILVPMLYSFIYLNSIWDVYGKLDNVPVAFVNLDKPITKDEKEYAIGKEVENNLKNNKQVAWEFVSHEDAIKGVEGTKYYATIEIPEDFSEKISNAQEGDFQNPEIIYIGNKGRNFVFSQISSKIAESIKSEVSSNIQEEISKALVDSLSEVKVSIKDAGDGASQLQSGTQKLLNGSSDLSNGLNTATEGSKLLVNGLNDIINGQNQVANGSSSLVDGLNNFKNNLTKPNDQIPLLLKGASDLNDSTTLIKQGAQQLNNSLNTGLNALADGVGQSANGINQVASIMNSQIDNINSSNLNQDDKNKLIAAISAINNINNSNIRANIEAPLRKAADSAQPLVDNLEKLETGSKQVSDGVSQLASGLADTQTKASQGLDQLIDGANKIQSGNSTLLVGLNTATDKTKDLANGLDTLNIGSISLEDGLENANNGAIKLKDGLNSGYDKMNDNLKFDSEDMSKFVSKPITLKDSSINNMKNYGEGLAPYFISLSLWLGAMFISTILSITKSANIFKSKFMNSFIGKYIVGSCLVAMQALVLSFTLVKGLDFNPASINGFYLSNIFIAIVFFSIMYGVSHAIGILGAPIMFIVLLLQLSSSGGTFPIETAPVFYRIVGKVIPMTYSINSLRMIISGINSSALNHNIIIMLIFIVASLLGGLLTRSIINLVRSKKQTVNGSQTV